MRNKKQLMIIIPPIEKQYVKVTVIDKTKYSLYNVINYKNIEKNIKNVKNIKTVKDK